MTQDINLLSVSVMRHILPIFILSLCSLALTSCKILEEIQNSAGTYEGKTLAGKDCKVEIRVLMTPAGLCRWVSVSLSTEETLVGHEETKRFCVGTSNAYSPTEFKITQGDESSLQQVKIQDDLLVDVQNQRPRAVLFLDSKNSCQQLAIK